METTTRKQNTTLKPSETATHNSSFGGCGVGYKCLSKNICLPYQSKLTVLESLPRDTSEFTTMLAELRGLICNRKEEKVCCDQSSGPSYIPNIANGECGQMVGGDPKIQRNGRIVGE